MPTCSAGFGSSAATRLASRPSCALTCTRRSRIEPSEIPTLSQNARKDGPLDDHYRAILPNFRAITFARWLFYGFDLRRKQMEWKRDGVPPPSLVHHRLAQALRWTLVR
jgi:hypothetical protein